MNVMEIPERHPLGNSESMQGSQWKNQENNMMEKQRKSPFPRWLSLVCFQAVEAALKSITEKVYVACISTEMTRDTPTLSLFFWGYVYLNFTS